MATYTLTIYVEDISTVIQSFNQVRIYRSVTGNQADRALYSSFSLVSGQSTYEWTDSSGAAAYVAWFTYYNSSTLAESGYSDSMQYGAGDEEYVPGFSFSYATYPDEYSISYDDSVIVDNIRMHIGDPKSVKRDYVNPAAESLYANVANDYTTYILNEPPGWPFKVILDDVSYETLANPIVNGYEYLTFSGTTISTSSGVLDVWYENFRHSDREILHTYYNTDIPSPLTSANVTTEAKKLAAAIAILESELRNLMGSVDGSFAISGDTSFDPSSVLRARREDLNKLRTKLKDLIDDITDHGFYNLTGIRIE